MKKCGFDLFKTRKKSEVFTIDIERLENIYNIKLPPLYRLFLETFHVETSELMWLEKYLPDDTSSRLLHWGGYKYSPNAEVRGLSFNNLEDAFEEREDTADWGEYPPYEKELLHIAYLAEYNNGGIFLGTQMGEEDKIFLYKGDTDRTDLKVIASNIFEFVRGFEFVIPTENNAKIDLEKIYKNWDEDFWRMKK
jgi:hypothetical protein